MEPLSGPKVVPCWGWWGGRGRCIKGEKKIYGPAELDWSNSELRSRLRGFQEREKHTYILRRLLAITLAPLLWAGGGGGGIGKKPGCCNPRRGVVEGRAKVTAWLGGDPEGQIPWPKKVSGFRV